MSEGETGLASGGSASNKNTLGNVDWTIICLRFGEFVALSSTTGMKSGSVLDDAFGSFCCIKHCLHCLLQRA
jgi:hypothetical protein